MHQIGGGGRGGGGGKHALAEECGTERRGKEGTECDVYIPLGDVRVSTYKAVERCAIDAAFFTFLDIAATFCEFRPRMPDEMPPPPEGSI